MPLYQLTQVGQFFTNKLGKYLRASGHVEAAIWGGLISAAFGALFFFEHCSKGVKSVHSTDQLPSAESSLKEEAKILAFLYEPEGCVSTIASVVLTLFLLDEIKLILS